MKKIGKLFQLTEGINDAMPFGSDELKKSISGMRGLIHLLHPLAIRRLNCEIDRKGASTNLDNEIHEVETWNALLMLAEYTSQLSDEVTYRQNGIPTKNMSQKNQLRLISPRVILARALAWLTSSRKEIHGSSQETPKKSKLVRGRTD
ncbi:MAG: hypothetical protein QM808_17705 [Steroidobacteraceae bacterium]